jgi:hypothetical protein
MMRIPTHRRILVLTEGLNPLVWARDGAKSINNNAISWAGRGVKNLASAAGRAAGSFLPDGGKKGIGAVSSGLGFKTKAESDFERRNSRFTSEEENKKSRAPGKPGTEKPKKEEPAPKQENEHKYINNYLLRNNLRSTRVTRLPTVGTGKSSGRFGLVDAQGKPTLIFYPFAPLDDLKQKDNDTGFVMFDTATKKMKVINRKLATTQYPNAEGFITLENSPSRVPHYTR